MSVTKSVSQKDGIGGRQVRLMQDADRPKVIEFLKTVDDKFIPPLSSPYRRGSLDGYIDYTLDEGRGRALIYEAGGKVVGFLGYRYEGDNGDKIYWSNVSVENTIIGALAFEELCKGMIQQVESDKGDSVKNIWTKTWSTHERMLKIYPKLGLTHVDTIKGDFDGTRDSLVYEGSWDGFKAFFEGGGLPAPHKPGEMS